MSKIGKFPKTIFVKRENEGDGENEYMAVFDEAETALESGETVFVATYELKQVRKGRLLPEFKST